MLIEGMCVAAGQFIGWQHRDNVGHSRNRPQRFFASFVLVADQPDDRPVSATTNVRRQSKRFHPLDDMFQLRFRGTIRRIRITNASPSQPQRKP